MPSVSEESEKERLADSVYAAILDAICGGTLPPGTRLGQEWLAERLNVSRQPIGQALALMKTQGFVTEVGRRGLMVASLTTDYVASMYEVRGALDGLAAGLAARRCREAVDRTAAARERFDQIFFAGRAALESRSVNELIAADVAFHGYIYTLSGNAVVGETMELLWNRMRWVMSAYLREIDWAKATWDEHHGIAKAIIGGDADSAEGLIKSHLSHAIELIDSSIARGDGHGIGGHNVRSLGR